MEHPNKTLNTDILIVGAGIAGISTALEAAETGYKVILVEKNSYIGGRVAQLNQYFPKMCPPTCGLEINIRRMRENSNISLLTLCEVKKVEGKAGNYNVELIQKPRYVNNRCTSCGECVAVCPVERDNCFNFGLDKTKAIYIAYNNAYPQKYVIDGAVCKGKECNACVEVCKFDAIDLDDKAKNIHIQAKAIVWATGWNPYNAENLTILGYKKYPNILTNVEFERLSAPNGPTNGKIELPSLKKLNSVAFVQCAGSRDENHLEYCSSICCLASLKQARYIREQYPDAEIHIFYIDIRTPGIFEDFFTNSKKDDKLYLHRGKIAKVFKADNSDKLIVEAEDTINYTLKQTEVDLVILATGMQPTTKNNGFPLKELLDNNGFVRTDISGSIIGCGVCTSPKDVAGVVQEATGSAIKAIHIIKGGRK